MARFGPRRRPRIGRAIAVVAGIVAAFLLAIGLCLVPAVQRALLRKALLSSGADQIEIGRLRAGLSGFSLGRVQFVHNGLHVDAGSLTVRVVPSRLAEGRLIVAECVGRNLDCSYDLSAPAVSKTGGTASLSATSGTAAAASSAGIPRSPNEIFAGLLKSFRLRASVEAVDLSGRLNLVRGTEAVAVCTWQCSGGGFAPDSTGTLHYSFELSSPASAAAGPWHGHGTIRVAAGRDGSIESLAIRGETAAPGAPNPAPACLYDLSVSGRLEGEDYRAVIAFPEDGGLEFNGRFRRETSVLVGRIELNMKPAAAGFLQGAGATIATATASIDLSANFATQQMQAKAAVDILTNDLPQLGVIGAVRCHAEAVAQGDGSLWTLASGAVTISPTGGPGSARLQLLGPMVFWPWKRSGAAVAELRLDHLPLPWANPWLKPCGISVGPGELNAAWRVALAPDAIELSPVEPLDLEPIRARGGSLPSVLPLHLRASPRLGFTATGMSIVADDFRLETEKGDSVTAKLDMDISWQDGVTQLKAGFDGALPTLLSGPEHPLPFLITGRCAMSRSGKEVTLSALQFALRPAPKATPFVALGLAHPFAFEAGRLSAVVGALDTSDLAQFSVKELPLAWISRWLPGRSLEGAWSEGESVVRYEKGRGLILWTTTPWRATNLRFAVGGREVFRGNFSLSPGAAFGSGERWIRLEDIAGEDANGNRLRGSLNFDMHGAADRPAVDISLVVDLPALPNSGGTFGPLQASFSAAGSAESAAAANLDRFAFKVVDGGGSVLVSAQSEAPVLIERTPQSEWLASSPRPLRFACGRIPLAWLNPYLIAKGFAIEGTLQPTEMELQLSPGRFHLSSVEPLAVEDFKLERRGDILVDRGLLHFRNAFDLSVSYALLPVFHVNYTTGMNMTYGVAAAGGERLARFENALEIAGSEKKAEMRKASGAIWADLGAIGRLPLLAHARLPAQGIMNLEISNDPVKTQVIEVRGQLTGLVGRDGRPAPAVEWVARARADAAERIGGFRVEATLHSTPRPSDATFLLKVDRQNLELLDISSKFESRYLDLDAVRDFAAAFSPARPRKPRPAASTVPQSQTAGAAQAPGQKAGAAPLLQVEAPSTPAAAGPIWGGLRGTFSLDIGTLAFAPYTIEHLVGQWVVTDDTFALQKLTGGMLGGDWTADLAVKYAAMDPAGPYRMIAHFGVNQLDTQKAVALAFPNETAKIDGRLSLAISMSGGAERIEELADHATGDFSMSARDGVLRLTLPKADMTSSLLILGGSFTFSPELRALGRLVRQLSNVEFDRCEASGRLAADGELTVEQFHLDSPQLRFSATGRIADARTRDLLRQPIVLHASLAARQDLAVILSGMRLLNREGADGFRPLTQELTIGGAVGQPDLHPLYDFLARAVSGAHGTWGILMRDMQAAISKRPPAGPAH